jgi:4-diphosphocytidyl-2-C-methyl-D-erythritol kinase
MIKARAFAKINLDLQIVGVRDGGYHDLRTVFQSIALHDVLTCASARRGIEVETDDSRCPVTGNIVEQAALALWRAAGRRGSPPGVRIRIEKRIPIEAGLGGGSADAAAALRALAVVWRIKVSARVLHDTAASLGADVPFFLYGGTAVGVERGDRVTRVADHPRRWVVLAVPPFGVSTRDAYRWFDEAARVAPGARRGRFARSRDRSRTGRAKWTNDLQAPVAARHPEIGQLVAGLADAGATYAAMSGSGSAVFGLFSRLAAAEAAAGTLVAGGRRVIVTRSISRALHARLTRPVLARK